jgi:hypothetical protein
MRSPGVAGTAEAASLSPPGPARTRLDVTVSAAAVLTTI